MEVCFYERTKFYDALALILSAKYDCDITITAELKDEKKEG